MCFCFVLFNLTCAEIYKPKSYIARLWHERVKKKKLLCPNDFSDQEIFMDQSHAYIALSGLELTETLLGLIHCPFTLLWITFLLGNLSQQKASEKT